LRNLDIFEREGLVERAAAMGARLLTGLQTLRDLPRVGDVRGLGLMAAVELVEDKGTKAPALGPGGRVIAEARARGLITRLRAGQGGDYPIGDTICVAPPLVVTEAQVDRIVAILRESIRAAAA
jgi:4-aminobutyrate aminotransferase-like enzyme